MKVAAPVNAAYPLSVRFDPAPFEESFRARLANVGSIDPSAYLSELAQRASSQDWLNGYAKACPVDGARPRDYAPRLLTLSPQCQAIAAIHFRGCNLDFPFVDVSAESGPLPDPLPLQALVEAFAHFRPLAARVWHSPRHRLRGQQDLLVVAGSLSLGQRPPLEHVERIRLEPDPTLSGYPDYVTTYQEVIASRPEVQSQVECESAASLLECAQFGACYRIFVDGHPAGLIAARPERFRCVQGWLMVEIVLRPQFQGQGLAAPIQQAFLKELNPKHGQTVFGTIDATNVRSLNTALRVGRSIVEASTFIAVPPPQGQPAPPNAS